jgi:trehalose utilization protein
MTIRVVVWGENVHEHENETVRSIYPEGMHTAIAKGLDEDPVLQPSTATLQEPEHGLSAARLAETDVLVWWGHKAHGQVSDEIVERVVNRVWEGMGLIVLHSGHFSKVFKRLMGTPCSEPQETVFVTWYEGGEVFRSGLTWTRGGGKVFYFSPGHETYPIYYNADVKQVLKNAVKWAYNPAPAWAGIANAPNTPADKAPNGPLTIKGGTLHKAGEAGFR